jgi:hypothetical protein
MEGNYLHKVERWIFFVASAALCVLVIPPAFVATVLVFNDLASIIRVTSSARSWPLVLLPIRGVFALILPLLFIMALRNASDRRVLVTATLVALIALHVVHPGDSLPELIGYCMLLLYYLARTHGWRGVNVARKQ